MPNGTRILTSIMFADIVGSTPLFAELEPSEAVDWLNQVYSLFDRLVEKHDLEKIRTIGDNYMVAAGVTLPREDHAQAMASFALDMATLRARFIFASGDDEGSFDDDFQQMNGQTFSWSELMSDGYTYDRNPANNQIGGSNHPSNMYAINVGADLKPTDTTTIKMDVYYIGMVEDRTVAGEKEDEIGTEVDVRLIQKIYDNFSMSIIGAYLFAEDGYGVYNGDPDDPTVTQAAGSGDDAFQVGIGLDYKF